MYVCVCVWKNNANLTERFFLKSRNPSFGFVWSTSQAIRLINGIFGEWFRNYFCCYGIDVCLHFVHCGRCVYLVINRLCFIYWNFFELLLDVSSRNPIFEVLQCYGHFRGSRAGWHLYNLLLLIHWFCFQFLVDYLLWYSLCCGISASCWDFKSTASSM